MGLMRRYDAAAVLLLLAGGVILPVVGWIIGVVLLIGSRRWSLRDKLIGILVWPGGLALAVGFVAFAPAQECVSVKGAPSGSRTCTGTALPGWVGVPVLVLAIVGPLVTALYLSFRARRR